jgi:multimeric flavodoxin WrbA
MKIAVLNGSPKGLTSVTMQYVHYIQKQFPEHELEIVGIHNRARKVERDDAALQEILDVIRSSDGVLWAFPVYYMLVPGYYKRFIELIWEKGVEDVFRHKHAAVLATSIKYFDHAALYYMQAICEDLGMKYHGSFSPEMYLLAKEEGRVKTRFFAENFFEEIRSDTATAKSCPPVTWRDFRYQPGSPGKRVHPGNKKVLVLTDSDGTRPNLDGMIQRFRDSFTEEIELLNINDVRTDGPCLGCIKCWYDHQCVYKDDFAEVMKKKVLTADILVFSGAIKDRFLSSRWKIWLDRSFCNGHTAWLPGKQIAFIVAGPLNQIPNIKEIFQVFFELLDANMVGFVSDEYGDSEEIDKVLADMAGRLVRFADHRYVQPPTDLGEASKLLFREVFWGRFRFPFIADYHAYFKNLGEREFPHKDYRTRIRNRILMLLSYCSPAFRSKMTKNMKQNLLLPLRGVLED